MKPQGKRLSWLAAMICTACVIAPAGVAQELRPQARPEIVAAAVPDSVPDSVPDAAPQPAASAALPAPTAPPAANPHLGPETNLPLPRFVSLKTDEGNVRRGPSMSHRIDWVFLREDMFCIDLLEDAGNSGGVSQSSLGHWWNFRLLATGLPARQPIANFRAVRQAISTPDPGNALSMESELRAIPACHNSWMKSFRVPCSSRLSTTVPRSLFQSW